jgi:Fe-S-cluster containining protein
VNVSVKDAGPFSAWLHDMRAVLHGDRGADVPCGDCVGCCVSAYPIPLRATDRVAQERVPEQFVLHAPGRPAGELLMGYREDGSCPFLANPGCSIYADRPQTCRDYDCRIYSAAGLTPSGNRPVIQNRVAEWQFSYPRQQDNAQAAAVRQAAAFITAHGEQLRAAIRVVTPTAVAVLAVKTYEVFLVPQGATSDDAAREVLLARVVAAARAFDAQA